MTISLGWNEELEAMHAEQLAKLRVPLKVSTPVSADIPDELDTSWFKPEDQGPFNSCCGNANAGLGEYLWFLQTKGEVLQFSRRWMYVQTKKRDKSVNVDDGASISGGMLVAAEDGYALEQLVPYWRSGERYSPVIPNELEARRDASERRLRSVTDIKTYDDMDRWLTSGAGGVLIGIDWVEGQLQFKSAFMDREPGGRSVGGHALWLGGWTTRGGERWPFMHNSHRGWGVNQRTAVNPKIIDKWCRNNRFGVKGGSDMTIPQTRTVDFSSIV
jgi:hypothetical protein